MDPRIPPTPVAVVAAHPDDETLGLGGRLAQFEALTLIHITAGAPADMQDARRNGFETAEEYATARRRELGGALATLGAAPSHTLAYGYRDKEAVLALTPLALRLVHDLADARVVITHPYEHGHPDHDAAAFAVHSACALLARRRVPPTILEFPSYHLRHEQVIFGRFWPDSQCEEYVVALSTEERERKSRALACFVTQRELLQAFPLAEERYRVAPAYDFSRPAPPRSAFYDRLGWGITSDIWREYAAAARVELGLDATLEAVS